MKKFVAVSLMLAFVLLVLPVRSFSAGALKENGALAGHIYNEDMRTPVRNAVVMLRNVATQEEYMSEPTDPDGMYRIPEIEEGRYVMGVKSPKGSYNFHYSIMIKSDGLAKLSLAMKPGGDPVMLQQGMAAMEKKGILEFFKSPAGILMLITAMEVTLFAIVLSEGEVSPIDN